MYNRKSGNINILAHKLTTLYNLDIDISIVGVQEIGCFGIQREKSRINLSLSNKEESDRKKGNIRKIVV